MTSASALALQGRLVLVVSGPHRNSSVPGRQYFLVLAPGRRDPGVLSTDRADGLWDVRADELAGVSTEFRAGSDGTG